jgi:hypothetical protein
MTVSWVKYRLRPPILPLCDGGYAPLEEKTRPCGNTGKMVRFQSSFKPDLNSIQDLTT